MQQVRKIKQILKNQRKENNFDLLKEIKYRHFQDIIVGDVIDIFNFIQNSGTTINDYIKSFEIGNVTADGTWRFNYVSVLNGIEQEKEYSISIYTKHAIDTLLIEKVDILTFVDTLQEYVLATDFENLQEGVVINVDLDSTRNYQLKITKGSGNSTYLNIAGNTRYEHSYTMKPTQNWLSPAISFKLCLPSSTPLTSDGLLNYLGLSPFWSTVTPSYDILSVNGVTTVANGVPTVAIGMFVYIEDSGGMINKTLKILYNYNSAATFDIASLKCTGIQDRFTGSWINLQQAKNEKTIDKDVTDYNNMKFEDIEFDIDTEQHRLEDLKQQMIIHQKNLLELKARTDNVDKADEINKELNFVDNMIITEIPKGMNTINIIRKQKGIK